jgi:hypothetical protein
MTEDVAQMPAPAPVVDTLDVLASKVTEKNEAKKAEREKAQAANQNPEPTTPPEVPKSTEVSEQTPQVTEEISNQQATEQHSEKVTSESTNQKPWWDSESLEDKKTESEKDDKNKYNELQEKASKLDEILNDKLIHAIYSAKKEGKDISSILTEIQPPRLEGLKPEDIYRKKCENMGLSPEEVETEMEWFKELSPMRKREEAESIKKQIVENYEKNLSKYVDASVENSRIKEQQIKAAIEKTNVERTNFFEKIRDKDWMGVKMTQSEISKLDNFLESQLTFTRNDGSFDYEKFAQVGHFILNHKTIMQNAYNKGVTDAKQNILLEMSRSSAGDKRFNSAPDVAPPKSKSDKAKDTIKGVWG